MSRNASRLGILAICLLPIILGSAHGSGGGASVSDGPPHLAPDLPEHSPQMLAFGSPNPSPEPGYYETSEYMIGSIAVGVFLLESDGSVDPSTEDWTEEEEQQVHGEIAGALSWWSSENPGARVTFTVDYHYAVQVGYEPINRPSSQEGLWISQAMGSLGYSYGTHFRRVRSYLNDLRDSRGTDWAFAIFVVDSSNDIDGCFTDDKPDGTGKMFAYAYLGGPFLVMTYDNDGWGINRMNQVCAHEIGHIFYATDEYDDAVEYSGYLNVPDRPHSGCLMDSGALSLSAGTWGQIGWRDGDGDGIPDIVDTQPKTTIQPQSPDPTTETVLTYHGSALESPYPNHNPNGPGLDVSISSIVGVEYRIDSGPWAPAVADDGGFNELQESFHFATPPLGLGAHLIQARSRNWAGNRDTSPPGDYVTILSYEFAVTMWPDNISLKQGGNATFTTYVELRGSTSENTTLHLDGLPQAVGSYEFSPPWGRPPFFSNISIFIREDGQCGSCSLTIRGESQHLEVVSNAIEVVVLDEKPPSSSVLELEPNIFNSTFTVSWSGSDNAGGSGIKCYDVQYREAQGEWRNWLTGTNLTSSNFTGEMPQFYRFRCRAWDWAGNCEDYPEAGGDVETVLGFRLVIHTPYSLSQALIKGTWYQADDKGDLKIALLPGFYAVEVESVVDLGPGERGIFDTWGDGNASNPRYIDLDSNMELDTSFHEEYNLLLSSPRGHPEESGWYRSGSNASISIEDEIDYGNATRDLFSTWTGDGNISNANSSVLMNGPHFFRAVWAREYLLEVKSRYGTPTGGGWYSEGSVASFSVSSPVDQGNLTRRAFAGWSGDVASESIRGQTLMEGPKEAVALWRTEYYLKVESDYGDPQGENWYEAGSVANFSVGSVVDLGNGTRRVFLSWTGDADTESNQGHLPMTSPQMVRALWKRQYLLGVWSRWGEPTKGGWKDAGSSITISVSSPVDQGNGTRRVFSSWEGDAKSEEATLEIVVTGPTRVFATWEKEHLLSIQGDYGSSHGSGWYPEGAEATVAVPRVIESKNGTRRVFVEWGDDLSSANTEATVRIEGPVNVSVHWRTEYHLTVETHHGTPIGEGWYGEGIWASFGIEESIVAQNMTRYVFTSWSEDAHTESQRPTIQMDGPKTVMALWGAEYYAKLTSRYGTPIGEGWYGEGDLARFSVGPVLEFPNGTRRVCNGWRWRGVLLETNTTMLINEPVQLSAEWGTEYYLGLKSPWGHPKGGGWKLAGAHEPIMVEAQLDWGNGTRLRFACWEGGAEDPSNYLTNVTMDLPRNLEVIWRKEFSITLAFVDQDGRSLGIDTALLLGPRNQAFPAKPGNVWLEEGNWEVVSVIVGDSEVSPADEGIHVEAPTTWQIPCEVYDLQFDIKDAIGLPVSNVLVEADFQGGQKLTTRTGADGRCRFTQVPGGQYVATVLALGFKKQVSGRVEEIHGLVPVRVELSGYSLIALLALGGFIGTILLARVPRGRTIGRPGGRIAEADRLSQERWARDRENRDDGRGSFRRGLW